MALKLRLARGGSKKRPFYRIVVAENSAPRDGRFVEKIGTYNPLLPKDHEDRLRLDTERAAYWVGKGARPTDRVARFLGEAKIIPMPEQGNNPQKAKPKAKAMERLAEKEEKAKAAEEAAAAAEAEAKAAAEAPVEEAPAEEAAAPAEETEAATEEAPAAEEPAAEAPAEEAAEEETPKEA